MNYLQLGHEIAKISLLFSFLFFLISTPLFLNIHNTTEKLSNNGKLVLKIFLFKREKSQHTNHKSRANDNNLPITSNQFTHINPHIYFC